MAACPTRLLPSTNGRLARHIGIEVLAAERLPWLGDSCLQGAEVAKNRLLPALFHHETVEEQHLSQAEVPPEGAGGRAYRVNRPEYR
jgi:hypothetical protein